MEWAERMNRALDYLEEHLEGDTDYREAAARSKIFRLPLAYPAGKGYNKGQLKKCFLAMIKVMFQRPSAESRWPLKTGGGAGLSAFGAAGEEPEGDAL